MSKLAKLHAVAGGLHMVVGILCLPVDLQAARESLLLAFMFLTFSKNNGELWK